MQGFYLAPANISSWKGQNMEHNNVNRSEGMYSQQRIAAIDEEIERKEQLRRDEVRAAQLQTERNRQIREAEVRAQQEAREAQERAQARARLEDEKKLRSQAWMNAGGDQASFERAWPEMKQEILMSRMLTDEERERRSESII